MVPYDTLVPWDLASCSGKVMQSQDMSRGDLSSQQCEYSLSWKIGRHSFWKQKLSLQSPGSLLQQTSENSVQSVSHVSATVCSMSFLDWNSWFSGHRHSKTYLSSQFHTHICCLEALLEKATEPARRHRFWPPLWLMRVTSEEWHKGGMCCMLQDFKLIKSIKGPNSKAMNWVIYISLLAL